MLIDDSVVTGNDAANEGGGLWNSAAGTMTVTDTVIAGNTAPIGPNVFQQGAVAGGFTVDGQVVPIGQNDLRVSALISGAGRAEGRGASPGPRRAQSAMAP